MEIPVFRLPGKFDDETDNFFKKMFYIDNEANPENIQGRSK